MCLQFSVDNYTSYRLQVQGSGASFQLFLGGPNFFYIFQCHRTIEKLEKKTALYM